MNLEKMQNVRAVLTQIMKNNEEILKKAGIAVQFGNA